MEMRRDALLDAALEHWPGLAADLGLSTQGWRAAPLARRDDPHHAVVLVKMTGPEGQALVLKHVAAPSDLETYARAMSAHQGAQKRYPEGVPALLSFDLSTQTCVMDYAEGRMLSLCLAEAGPAQRLDLLRRAGAWLDGLHRAGLGDPRQFQSKFTLRYLRQIREDVLAGRMPVAEPGRFCAAAETLLAREEEFSGQQTQAAPTHGDLHLRSLLVGTSQIWGIDFAGGRMVPVGHDIARLLVDAAVLYADADEVPVGEVIPADWSAAFFEGYRLVAPEDPSVRLLLRHRMLADWWGLPAFDEDRGPAQARRLRNLLALAPRIFG